MAEPIEQINMVERLFTVLASSLWFLTCFMYLMDFDRSAIEKLNDYVHQLWEVNHQLSGGDAAYSQLR